MKTKFTATFSVIITHNSPAAAIDENSVKGLIGAIIRESRDLSLRQYVVQINDLSPEKVDFVLERLEEESKPPTTIDISDIENYI